MGLGIEGTADREDPVAAKVVAIERPRSTSDHVAGVARASGL